MANISISLEGIDQAIANLKYRPGSVKFKAIQAIRACYTSEDSIKTIDHIDADAVIRSIWDVGDSPLKLKSKRRNFSSVKSSINADLEKLSKKELNPENLTLTESNIFDMTEEAKSNLLSSFTDAVKTGDIDLEQATSLLQAVSEFLDDYQADNDNKDPEDILNQIRNILKRISHDIPLEEDEEIEEVEIDEDEDIEEVEEIEEDDDIEEIEIDEDEDLEEVDDLEDDIEDDIEEIELDEDEDLEEIELDEDEDLEEIEEIDEDEDIEEIELDEDGEIEEVDDLEDDIEEIELDEDEDLEEIELDEDEDLEEIEEIDEDEDIEEIELDEDEDLEEVEIDEDEEIEEIEEDEGLEEIDDIEDDIEEIELDEDEDLEEIEEIDEDEDIEEIEIDEDEDLEDIDELDEDELKALEEFREKRELAEQFDQTLGEREKKYNKYTTIPEGDYTIGSKKSLKSNLELQQFHMPKVYMGIYPVTNAFFEIFIEETGYVTTAEKRGFGRVYTSNYKRTANGSDWNKNSGSEDVEGACWFHPSGPLSNLHGKRNHPVVQVSVEDAMMFSSWIGRRLPTEAEWEAAARTDIGNKYPWGNTFEPDALNIEQSGIADTSEVDKFDKFANEFQLCDMLGNVMEWTSDTQAPPIKTNSPILYNVAKGAAWNAKNTADISSRALFKPGFTSNTIGFRCTSEIFL